jgi:hypothetical protein
MPNSHLLLMGETGSGLYKPAISNLLFSFLQNPQMLHMLQKKGKQVSGHATIRRTTFRPNAKAQT